MDPFDLATVFTHRARIEGLDPNGPPTLEIFGAQAAPRSVALLPGSFDPPTAAHRLLAERALREGYEHVVFVLARHTAGKGPGGLLLEDRLLAMRRLANGAFGVAVSSHALYAEQARAAVSLSGAIDMAFLVGSDKVLQIFDPSWYEDREWMLEQLFARAHLLVAPRSDQGDALRACLSDPANARWVDRIHVLRLHPAVVDLSSTHVRGMLRAGAEPGGLVPPEVARFLGDVRAFSPHVSIGGEEVDAYQLRARLLDHLWRIDPAGSAHDLRALTELALSNSAAGEQLRGALRWADDPSPLAEALASLRR